MKKCKLGWLLFIIAQEFAMVSATWAAPTNYNWNGFYLGAIVGGTTAKFNNKTSTQPGALTPAEANVVNSEGNQSLSTQGFLSGIQAGYNWQFNQLLLGLESDIQALSLNDDMYTGAIPSPTHPEIQYVITSYANNNWLFTLRPRFGFVTNNLLLYVTGGLSLSLIQSDFVFSDNNGAFESKRASQIEPGYVIGAGIETGLTNHISMKGEYLYENVGNVNASNMNHHLPANQGFLNTTSLKANLFRVSLNYHFDDTVNELFYSPFSNIWNTNEWETEIGTRLFLSTGVDGAPQPLLNTSVIGNVLASRLIFSDLTGISEETFARIDHSSGLFAKGYLGAGSITDGQLNDEDFPAGGAYSNTLSNALGNLSYATIDLGYSFFKTPSAKTGAFIGYNYYVQNINVYDCQQLAGALVCANPSDFSNFLGISEEDKYTSMRIGLSSQLNLTDELTLTSEATYLPFVNFSGQDIHDARQLIGPESASRGDGSMLETVLDYQFSRSWSLGLGWRYWMWNMHNGSVLFDFLGEGTISEPARFNTERYGMFLQLNYRNKKPNQMDITSDVMNWKGIFIGAHLGGAWGKTDWSDPFGPTPAEPGLQNMSGFGDQIRSTGPLGGINVNINWQTDRLIYGIGANMNIADIRGENTLFSGIGGINGQIITNYFGSIVGRIGTTLNRSLLYINAGRAVQIAKYKLNGNTNALLLGTESETDTAWGWTGGVGVEYALTDHWTTNVEYNYIRIPDHTVSFSSIALVNDQQISTSQILNVFQLGVNYKFDVLG